MGLEKRGNIVKEIKQLSEVSDVESELQDIDLYKLLKVYERVLRKFEEEKNKPIHTVVQYPYTIENQKEYILTKLSNVARLSFEDVISEYRTKIAMVYNFLAILELLTQGYLMIYVGEGFNNFWVEKRKAETEEAIEL